MAAFPNESKTHRFVDPAVDNSMPGEAVARFLPLGTRVMEGAVQEVIGTGAQGRPSPVGRTFWPKLD